MSKAISRRRGTTADHSQFTGLDGELTVDTTKKVVVVHDGQTAGGHPMAREDHLHSGIYTPKAHESDPSAHPELAASDEEVDARTGSKFLKVGQLARAVVKSILDILPVTLGGTGASTVEGARANLGLGSVATEDVLPLAKGGTGASTASAARDALHLGDAATRDTVTTSSGAADTGKIPTLDATGKLALGFIPTVEVAYVPEAGHAVNADAAITAQSADTATTATSASSATNADKVDGYHAHKTPNPNTIPVADGNGKLDAGWFPAMQADTVDGFHAAQTPTANTIPVAGPSGKLDAGWIPPMADVDAATLKGKIPSVTPQANAIPIAGADGKLASGWLTSPSQSNGAAFYTTPGTYTFTIPDNVVAIRVTVQGGGGSNGKMSANGNAGGTSSFSIPGVAALSATGGAGGLAARSSAGEGIMVTAEGGMGAGGNLLNAKGGNGEARERSDGYSCSGGQPPLFGTGGTPRQTHYCTSGTLGGGASYGALRGHNYGPSSGAAGGLAMSLLQVTPGAICTIVVGAGGANPGWDGTVNGAAGGNGYVFIEW